VAPVGFLVLALIASPLWSLIVITIVSVNMVRYILAIVLGSHQVVALSVLIVVNILLGLLGLVGTFLMLRGL
jgi:hypothetical protein